MIPTCMIRLFSEQLGDEVVCLGSQLAVILDELKEETHSCVWFVADIDMHQAIPLGIPRQKWQPLLVGNTNDLINFSSQVDQFLSGVFLAVPKSSLPLESPGEFDTEDDEFDDLGEAVLQIRAFDTSWFEIYAIDQSLLQPLITRFEVPVRYR